MSTIASIKYTEQGNNWAAILLKKWPSAGSHNSDNYIFVTDPESYTGQIHHIDDIVIEESKIAIDVIALTVAKWMVADDRSVPIIGSKSQISELHKHPAWRLWCFNYEDSEDQKENDWITLREILVSARPDLASQWPDYNAAYTRENVRLIIKTALS